MNIRRWLLPLFTAFAVLFAVFFPQSFSSRWGVTERNVVHVKEIDETQLVTNYSLSGAERLYLLRRSGLLVQSGQICYGDSAAGVSVEVSPMLPDTEQVLYAASAEGPYDSFAGENMTELVTIQNSSIRERVYDYFYTCIYMLEGYGIIDSNVYPNLVTRYNKSESDFQVDYCSISDDSDPFFSMALLCITCTLQDSEQCGLSADTSIAVLMDEETGMIYALSLTGDPHYVLTTNPADFMILGDLMGVSCTEYREESVFSEQYPAASDYPSAKFNFSGYSYSLQQNYQSDSYASCDFNVESYLK